METAKIYHDRSGRGWSSSFYLDHSRSLVAALFPEYHVIPSLPGFGRWWLKATLVVPRYSYVAGLFRDLVRNIQA